MSLSRFHPIIAEWFRARFGSPTDVQARSWPAIAPGDDVLIAAPTGSGKTLAAFLSCLDALFKQALAGGLEDRTQVVYVSPLKALSNDIQKNLHEPLAEISERAQAAGLPRPEIRVAVRTGDTPGPARQQMVRRPPHILITTPESLYLLLTAEKSRRMLHDVRTVIVDEIHAVAPNKRGTHLALSLERLDALAHARPVRIGLSATQRPIETTARFLSPPSGCRIVDIGHRREMDLAVEVPKDELGAVATNAIWSDIYGRVTDLVREHRSTLVFVNTRRLAERVAHHLEERLHDLGGRARSHRGASRASGHPGPADRGGGVRPGVAGGRPLCPVPTRLSLPRAGARGVRRGGSDAGRRDRRAPGPRRCVPPSRSDQPPAPRAAGRPPGGPYLGRGHSGHVQLRGDRRAGRHAGRVRGRRLRGGA